MSMLKTSHLISIGVIKRFILIIIKCCLYFTCLLSNRYSKLLYKNFLLIIQRTCALQNCPSCLVNNLYKFFSIIVEKRKEAHGDSLDKQHKKKIEREEERLKNNNRDLSLVKMKSMFAIGFAFTALLSMFNSM